MHHRPNHKHWQTHMERWSEESLKVLKMQIDVEKKTLMEDAFKQWMMWTAVLCYFFLWIFHIYSFIFNMQVLQMNYFLLRKQ